MLSEGPPRDSQARQQARTGECQGPGVRRFRGGQKRLRTAGDQLAPDIEDGRHEEEPARQTHPHDGNEPATAAGDRGPAKRGQADGDRERRSRADELVDGAAGPVGQQHEHGRERPKARQRGRNEANLEDSDSHRRESTAPWQGGPGGRRAYPSNHVGMHRKYLPG